MPPGVEAELTKEVLPKKLAVVRVDEPLRVNVGGTLVAIFRLLAWLSQQICMIYLLIGTSIFFFSSFFLFSFFFFLFYSLLSSSIKLDSVKLRCGSEGR